MMQYLPRLLSFWNFVEEQQWQLAGTSGQHCHEVVSSRCINTPSDGIEAALGNLATDEPLVLVVLVLIAPSGSVVLPHLKSFQVAARS
jgi:hypothetical protein